jgi:hypothetical protein
MDAVSDRALMIAAALDESFAHEGISPQRIRDNSRLALLEFRLMTGTSWVEQCCTEDSSPYRPNRLRSAPPESASAETVDNVRTCG